MITLTNTPISSMIPNCPRFTMDLLSPHLQDPIARFSSCPVLPPTPPFPSPEYPPLVVQEPSESTEIIQAIAIMNGIVVPPARAMSMEEAIEQNQLPVLAHWLQKNDKELAEHLGLAEPIGSTDRFTCRFRILSEVNKLVAKPAENGLVLPVLMLLDRVLKLRFGFAHESVFMSVFENALKAGQQDLILAVLRKGYPIGALAEAFLLKKAAYYQPKIALVLAGENLGEEALLEGMKAAIEKDQVDLIHQILNVGASRDAIHEAAIYAAKKNHIEDLKRLIQLGLSEKSAAQALYFACDSGSEAAIHLLASLGSLDLNDRFIVSKLVETGFFPSEFSARWLPSKATVPLLEAYLRFGKLSDRDLIDSWPTSKGDRFSLFRAVLVDRSPLSDEIQTFLIDQLPSFSPKNQELAIRIAILKDHPDALINGLFHKSALSEETKSSLKELKAENAQYLKSLAHIRQEMRQNYPASPLEVWDEKSVRAAIIQNSLDILDWTERNASDPRFRYFHNDAVGQINALPNIVLRYFQTQAEAEEHLKSIRKIQDACERKDLNHIRVPNAFQVDALVNKDGNPVPIHLVIKELLPIAGHRYYEVKELLEALNQDPVTQKMVNGFFSELTSLVCDTGLTDLKPTNVPLLKDGSGIAIIDSDMQNIQNIGPENSLYKIPQRHHSLIDWVSPQNFEALGQTLDTDPSCSKAIDRKDFERVRKTSHKLEQEVRRFHLLEYGNDPSAPISLSAQDIKRLDPDTRDLCLKVVDLINRWLKTTPPVFSRRDAFVSASDLGAMWRITQDQERAFLELKKLGKIYSYEVYEQFRDKMYVQA